MGRFDASDQAYATHVARAAVAKPLGRGVSRGPPVVIETDFTAGDTVAFELEDQKDHPPRGPTLDDLSKLSDAIRRAHDRRNGQR
jgi:hypothetical protein